MNILSSHNIYIDKFPPGDHRFSTSIFLLTHLHTDHFKIPKMFCGDIFTTSPTIIVQDMLPNTCCNVHTLQYNKEYMTKSEQVLIPFRTQHTPFSCGFIFPKLKIIYLGDGRMTMHISQYVPIDTPMTILYDGLYENHPIIGLEPRIVLRTIFETYTCSALYCVHYGILSYIKAHDITLKFRIDETSVHPLLQFFIRYIDMYDANSPYIIIGKSAISTYLNYILPSSMWYIKKQKNINMIYKDGSAIRIFASCHAMPLQIKRWKHEWFPMHKFEAIVQNGI